MLQRGFPLGNIAGAFAILTVWADFVRVDVGGDHGLDLRILAFERFEGTVHDEVLD